MKTAAFATLALWLRLAGADCHGDNCANHVTGTFAGIGVPLSARISLCNDFLRTTVRGPPRTVTTTITKFLVHPSDIETQTSTGLTSAPAVSLTSVTANSSNTTSVSPSTVSPSIRSTEIITPSIVPTFAAAQCPGDGQFASACKCWTRVTARTSTIPASTVTVSTTVSVNVACSPAVTAVSNTTRFPCSSGFGMCSCLRTGDGDSNSGVCVRVGSGFWDDGGKSSSSEDSDHDDAYWDEDSVRSDPEYDDEGDMSPANWNVTGPCFFARECNVDYSCRGTGNVCVFDNSCLCGKRRCYKAVAGCKDLELPSYESNGAP